MACYQGMSSPAAQTADRATMLRDLVIANHILAHEGVLDAFGHVSVRDPENPAYFVIPRALGPERVTEADLQVFRIEENTQVSGDTRMPYAERAIHAAVYAARPDVLAVCHNHSPSIIPFGITGVPLRPVFHMGGFLGTKVPVWEPSAEFGDTDLLVRGLDQGRSLARTLGPGRVALMRGHGSVVVGATLPEVVYQSVYMEANAKLQLQAIGLGGPVRYLSDAEIAGTAGWQFTTLSLERAWGTWAARVGFPPEA